MPFRGTQWPRAASNVLEASRGSRRRPHNNVRASISFRNTHAAQLARTAHSDVLKVKRSLKPGRLSPSHGLFRNEPNVDPDSLRNTLEAHREANRASLIVKIAGKGLGRQPIVVPSLVSRNDRPGKAQAPGIRVYSPEISSIQETRRSTRQKVIRGKIGSSLLVQWTPTPEARYCEKYPWMKHLKPPAKGELEKRLTGIEQVGREMDAFSAYLQATPREERAVELALQDISTAIKEVDPEMKIDVVGSRATGLHSPLSDIDINVSTTTTRTSKTCMRTIVGRLAKHISATANGGGRFRSVRPLFRPRVPIVTGRHAPTCLEFQVQSTIDVFLSMQQTMSFVDEFPTLRPLFLVLKQMLTIRGLTQGSTGGLTSYPLLTMIVAALKFSEGKVDRRDAGGQLLFFLDMYADIDLTKTAISFSPLEYIVKRHPRSSILPQALSDLPSSANVSGNEPSSGLSIQDVDARRRFATIRPEAEFLMCLQDPANLQKDVGKAIYQIRQVQDTFIHIREKLKADLKQWEDSDATSEQGPLLATCVGGDYRIFEDMRNDLRESVDRITVAEPSQD